MRIDCYLSEECRSENALRKNIEEALVLENAMAEVNFLRVDGTKAQAFGFRGSPSIFINGIELQPLEGVGFS